MSPRSVATYVADAIACTVGSDDVIIRTFGSLDDRDRFLQGSSGFVEQLSFEVDAPPVIIGPTWIVTVDSDAVADQIQAVLGGERR